MEVVTHELAEGFLERASPLLLQSESEQNLPLGVALQEVGAPAREGRLFATLEAGGSVTGVVVWTAPYSTILGTKSAADAALVGAWAAERGLALSGVHGSRDAAEAFATAFAPRARKTWRLHHGENVYEVRGVIVPPAPPGTFREAASRDVERVAAWIADFTSELSLGSISAEGARRAASGRIERGNLFVWDDGELRTIAGLARPTPHGIAINYVFTPVEERGKGYAKACVAALSLRELERGKRAVCLHADSANPVSNQVYRSIGFVKIADRVTLDFV
jgi:uncharacterized protein